MIKKLSLLFFICILSALNINATVYEGSCGTNVRYSLDTSTGVLNITGTGAMTNFSPSYAPWYSYLSYIGVVEISNGVTSIGSYAFKSCFFLTSITIPNSVTSIGDWAFSGCDALTSVTIPNSVTSIGGRAFDGCSKLTSVHITDIAAWCKISFFSSYSNPLCYAKHLFMDGKEIIDLVIPNSVTSIGNYAFWVCSGLTSVTIGNSVTSIGDNAFDGTAWYNNQPDGLVYAGKVAYKYKGTMPNNTNIVLEDGTLGIAGDAFSYCSGLTSVSIPNSVTSIENSAFFGCSGLTSITIPNSVTSIGYDAFYNCSGLTSVTIPNSVTSIGEYAFDGCNALSSVIVGAATPLNITSYTFSNRANATLYVPIGSKTAYQAANYWKNFGEIVEVGELYSIDHTANRGAEFDLPILMNNGNEAITAFQFDVELPEGMTLLSAKLSDRKADQSNPVPTLQSDGSYRLATFSSSGSAFSGSEGTLLNLRVKVSTDATLGEQTVTLKNIELTTTSKAFELINQSSTITVLDVLTGDASGDGKVSIFDAVQIVNYILGNTPETFVELAADVDGNGKISIFDAVLTVNIILNQGSTNNARMTKVDNEREPQ